MGPWPFDPRGAQAESISVLYWILFACAVVVLAIVVGALTYSGIKFRDRPGRVLELHDRGGFRHDHPELVVERPRPPRPTRFH